MSKLNLNRKIFLEKEELTKFQEFIADSPSENAIIGNTSSWGILRTDFQNDTDFKVERGSNLGTIQLAKDVNRALTSEGKRIYQEAIDNITVPNDSAWYWVRISHEYSNQEPGVVSVNANGEVSGDGTQFLSVLRGQGTKVPTKIKFIKTDGSAPENSSFYEVVDVIDDQNCLLSSAVDFVEEDNLKVIVLGSTPIGEAVSSAQEEGLYFYDSCKIELVPEVVEDEPPTDGYIEDQTFYLARVQNNGGAITIQDKRVDWWTFNVAGLTDKLSIYNNLSDVNDIDEARNNLGVYSKTEVQNLLGSKANTTLSNLSNYATARNNLDVYSKAEVNNIQTGLQDGIDYLSNVTYVTLEESDDISGYLADARAFFVQYGRLCVVNGRLRFNGSASNIDIFDYPSNIDFPLSNVTFFILTSSNGGTAIGSIGTRTNSGVTTGKISISGSFNADDIYYFNFSFITKA